MTNMSQAVGPGPGRAVRMRRCARRLGRRTFRVRLVRAGMRYHFARGALFSGGVTYSALLSVTAALTILVNVLRAFLGNRPDLMAAALTAVDEVLPGLINRGSGTGMLDPETLVADNPWSWATIISSFIVLWTALTMMTGLRRSIRAMFGLAGAPVPFVFGKTRDLLGFFALGVGVLLASALGSAASFAGGAVFDVLGVSGPGAGAALRVAAWIAAAFVDACVFLLLFGVTAGVRPPRRDLVAGALLGAAGTGVLRTGGTSLLGSINDPLLASFAAIVTLLLWVNLAIRFTLFIAAWTANPPEPLLPVMPEDVHAHDRPNYVTVSAPRTLDWPHHKVTGSLLVDPENLRGVPGQDEGARREPKVGRPPKRTYRPITFS